MALTEFARSRRESTRVPSRSKITRRIFSAGISRKIFTRVQYIRSAESRFTMHLRVVARLCRKDGHNKGRSQEQDGGRRAARKGGKELSGPVAQAADRVLPADVSLSPAR